MFLIGSDSLLLVSGRVADRIGRRRVFHTGLVLFAASAVLSAAAPTVYLLIAGPFLGAAAAAMVIPAGLAMILPLFPSERHGTAVGMWSASGPIASNWFAAGWWYPSDAGYHLATGIDSGIDPGGVGVPIGPMRQPSRAADDKSPPVEERVVINSRAVGRNV